jgi:hypothetical protein
MRDSASFTGTSRWCGGCRTNLDGLLALAPRRHFPVRWAKYPLNQGLLFVGVSRRCSSKIRASVQRAIAARVTGPHRGDDAELRGHYVPAKAHAAIEALETHLDRQAANRRVRDRQLVFGASLASRESLGASAKSHTDALWFRSTRIEPIDAPPFMAAAPRPQVAQRCSHRMSPCREHQDGADR